VALALAIAPCLPLGIAHVNAADTNGDSEVDILDIQRAIACALEGGEQSLEADVNKDGRVDVLDVQRILSEATETHEPEEPVDPVRPDAVLPVPVVLAAVHVAQSRLSQPEDDAPRPACVYPTEAIAPPLDRLIASGLSPHGPPAIC